MTDAQYHSHIPGMVFFTKGIGNHKEKLNSFELALRDAGIAKFNLVSVSSILPPNCKVISREKGLSYLKAGQIVYTVMSKNETNEPGRKIAAGVGSALPVDKKQYGYLSEHHSFGQSEKEASEYVEDLAAEMLASTLGIPFDSGAGYDEKKEAFRIDGRILMTSNVVQTGVGNKKGGWVTVVAAAIFVI